MKARNSSSGKKAHTGVHNFAFDFVVLRFDYHTYTLWSNTVVFKLWPTEPWGSLRPFSGFCKVKTFHNNTKTFALMIQKRWRVKPLVPWYNQGRALNCTSSHCVLHYRVPVVFFKKPSLHKNFLLKQ